MTRPLRPHTHKADNSVRSVAGLSPRKPGFDPWSVHVRFVVDKVALRQVFLPALRFPLSVSFHQSSIAIPLPPTSHDLSDCKRRSVNTPLTTATNLNWDPT